MNIGDPLSIFDPVHYIYLNPELSNVLTVENALSHFNEEGSNSRLVFSLNTLPADFNAPIYLKVNNGAVLGNPYIPNDIRADLFSNDPERLSIIHYLREGQRVSNTQVGIIPAFNENMYKTFQKLTAFYLTPSDLYLDYIEKRQTDVTVVGQFNDFRLAVLRDGITTSNDMNLRGCLHIWNHNTSNNGKWEICNRSNNNVSSDLTFISNNGTVVTFTDNFEPGILNFTGKHRCTPDTILHGLVEHSPDELIGKIVVSTGRYKNLEDEEIISMDEAIPLVDLSTYDCDARVFGVIAGFERAEDTRRDFKVGSMCFSTNKKDGASHQKVIINSVGEGAIWVCNINGMLSNGDLICSSKIPGYGMHQKSDIVRNYSMAKITCDCTFDQQSSIYRCETFEWKGVQYMRALVGCVYLM
jgi:hypothetical protein